MKDWFGNEAIDFGDCGEMIKKYTNDAFVFITKEPFDDEGYVLFKNNSHKAAYDWLSEFKDDMELRGHLFFDVCVVDGIFHKSSV